LFPRVHATQMVAGSRHRQASSILNRDLFPFLFELRDCFPSLMRKKKEATYLLSKLSIPWALDMAVNFFASKYIFPNYIGMKRRWWDLIERFRCSESPSPNTLYDVRPIPI
jgi:hypothetical protein